MGENKTNDYNNDNIVGGSDSKRQCQKVTGKTEVFSLFLLRYIYVYSNKINPIPWKSLFINERYKTKKELMNIY